MQINPPHLRDDLCEGRKYVNSVQNYFYHSIRFCERSCSLWGTAGVGQLYHTVINIILFILFLCPAVGLNWSDVGVKQIILLQRVVDAGVVKFILLVFRLCSRWVVNCGTQLLRE